MDRLEPLVAASDHRISVTEIAATPDTRHPTGRPQRGGVAADLLHTEVFGRRLDRSVGRWSFSSITDQVNEGVHDPYDESVSDAGASDEGDAEVDQLLLGDADDVRSEPPRRRRPDEYVPGPLRDASGGHGVRKLGARRPRGPRLRVADVDPGHRLRGRTGARRPRLRSDTRGGTPAGAADGRALLEVGLLDALQAPLGPLFDGERLASFGRRDRLDELTFDLRLGAGGAAPTLGAIGELTASHLPDSDPLRQWAVELAAGGPGPRLSGWLTGSIDLIARVGPSGGERYVVADYKTNQLVPRDVDPTADHYRGAALVRAMCVHHYPLQALLYSVALHRYLSWRRPGYDPERHLGGAAYLFVRGMTAAGPLTDDGSSLGVFPWPIPPALVRDLSDLLGGIVEDGRG